MSDNDLPLSQAVVPIEQMQIDGIQGLPLAAQPLVPVNKMLQTSVLQLPASFAEHQNYSLAFAPLQAMHGDVEEWSCRRWIKPACRLEGPVSSASLKSVTSSGDYKEGVQHRNDASKECKLAEFKYKAEVQPQLSKDNLELQKHRDDLTAQLTESLEKDRTASALKWADDTKQMLSIGVNHQQNVMIALSNHVLGLKKLELEKDNISLEKKKIDLEMMKLKNKREPGLKRLQLKKTHRGGRDRVRGRHTTQSQPIVEEMEDSEG
ncbi:hypothetical protein AAVH_36623 [Aphelenchoides avenae]|nr:hypothetical protein AAVH_36623 [Aphelenchus avenae]